MISPTVSNGFGTSGTFSGYFFTFDDSTDGGTSLMSPACPDPCFVGSGASICVSGEGAEVKDDDDYSIDWGAGLGWNLSQAEGSDVKGTADLSGYTYVTVALQCNTQTTSLRAKLDFGLGLNYCAPIMCDASNQLALATDFLNECWQGGKQEALDPSMLTAVQAVQVSIYTSKGSTTPFDFCVTEISFQ